MSDSSPFEPKENKAISSEDEITARVRRWQENGRNKGLSEETLRERARLEIEQEQRQTQKAVVDEPNPPPSTPQ